MAILFAGSLGTDERGSSTWPLRDFGWHVTAHGFDQGAGVEWLLEVVGHAVFLARLVGLTRPFEHTGDEDDGQRGELSPKCLCQLVTRHVRQQQIDDGERWLLALGGLERLLAPTCWLHIKPGVLEEVRQQREELGRVVDNQNGRAAHGAGALRPESE